jgi:hypothetical protein
MMAEELLMRDSTIKVFFSCWFLVIFNYSPTLYLLYMYKLLHFNLIFPQVFGALRMSVKMLLMCYVELYNGN